MPPVGEDTMIWNCLSRSCGGTGFEPRLSDISACVVNLGKWKRRNCSLPRHLEPAWSNSTKGEILEDQACCFFKHLQRLGPACPGDGS